MTDWADEDYVSFDFETSGTLPEYALQPWRLKTGDAWITSIAWVYRKNGETHHGGMLMPDPLYIASFLQWCIDENRVLIGWNVQFDVQWLIALELHQWVKELRFMDGMLCWRHLEIEPEYETTRVSAKSYSLKTAVVEYIPKYAGYQNDVDFHDPDPVVRAKLHFYNIQDCLFTLQITKKVYLKLTARQRTAMWIETACIPMVSEANLNGMLVDTIHANHLSQQMKDRAKGLLDDLTTDGVTEKIVRSPKQMAELLFDKWKLPVIKWNISKKTGGKTRSTDKQVLHELAFVDKRVKKLRDYREALNNDTKFAQAPIESVKYCCDAGKTHPAARIFGTYTGRLTYSSKQGRNKDERPIGFALHQMPRIKETRPEDYRSVLVAPEGYTIVEFDAAGQEFRWMAIASNDLTMLQLCQPGEDPHSFMGARIINEDYRQFLARLKAKEKFIKDARQMGKIGNLSLQYRTSYKKLCVVARVDYLMDMQEMQAQAIYDTYHATYVRVQEYWHIRIAMAIQKGYAETFAHRRVQIRGDWNGSMKWAMQSTAINYPIQGTGADQKYLAMMMIKDYIQTIGAKFLLDLHDGVYLLVPDKLAKKAAVHIKDMLDNLPYGPCWGFVPPVPMPWDVKMGKSWGSLAEFKG